MNLGQRIKNVGRNVGATIANSARAVRSTVSNAAQGTYAAAARIRQVDIGSIFRPNKLDRAAYAAVTVGVSNAVILYGLERVVTSLQDSPTIAHAAYHLPAIAMLAADVVVAAKMDTIVQDARQRDQQRHAALPTNASYARSATLLAFAIVAAGYIGAATTRIGHLLHPDHSKDDVAALEKTEKRVVSPSCAEETIGGQRYASIGCSTFRFNDGADHGYIVSPADPERALVIAPFGTRKDPVTGEDHSPHTGIDVLTRDVYAAHRGRVSFVGGTNSTANVGGRTFTVGADTCIAIQAYKPEEHADDKKKEPPELPIQSLYCCVESLVNVGNVVEAGQRIGRAKSPCTEGTQVGSGRQPYVHFTLTRSASGSDGYHPIDPLEARKSSVPSSLVSGR